MTDEVMKTQVYNSDQLASANAYFDCEIEGETVRIQLTSRHLAKVEHIVSVGENLIAAYAILRQAHPRVFRAQPPMAVGGEITRVPLDANGNEQPAVKSITADRISVSMKDGKYYYKVIGKPFTEYGITVWPEVFENAGLTVTPENLPNIAGWHVDYIEKPANDKGKIWPDKVTRLLPPTK